MNPMRDAVIIDAVRTPRGIGKYGKGALHKIHPQRLGADEKDYFLGLPATGQPDTRTASTSGAAK